MRAQPAKSSRLSFSCSPGCTVRTLYNTTIQKNQGPLYKCLQDDLTDETSHSQHRRHSSSKARSVERAAVIVAGSGGRGRGLWIQILRTKVDDSIALSETVVTAAWSSDVRFTFISESKSGANGACVAGTGQWSRLLATGRFTHADPPPLLRPHRPSPHPEGSR